MIKIQLGQLLSARRCLEINQPALKFLVINHCLRLGLGTGAHELHKIEFEKFLKSDDSALESLELLTLKPI